MNGIPGRTVVVVMLVAAVTVARAQPAPAELTSATVPIVLDHNRMTVEVEFTYNQT